MTSPRQTSAPVGRPLSGAGHYLRDLTYGALDDAITTMASDSRPLDEASAAACRGATTTRQNRQGTSVDADILPSVLVADAL